MPVAPVPPSRFGGGQRQQPILLCALLCALLGTAGAAASGAQQDELDLQWDGSLSDLPSVELDGTWRFDAEHSDPMIEEFADGQVEYRIFQQPDRIVLQFVPEEGEPTIQSYRWDGSIEAQRRDGTEVRERARWTDAGRTLVIEGRWWVIADKVEINRYDYRYKKVGSDQLVLTQSDDHGATVWRFRRER